jgi:SAM-dependent methyltransferase
VSRDSPPSASVGQEAIPAITHGRTSQSVRRVARRIVGPLATTLIRNRPGNRAGWGTLRRLEPFSDHYGWDRGTPVDRFYIEQFLAGQGASIRGDVLEIRDSDYTDRFAGDHVCRRHVLDIDPANPQATVIADLCEPGTLGEHAYDSVVLTQTLHLLPDDEAALVNLWQALRPGGTLLLTAPCVSRIDNESPGSDFWRVTPLGFERQLAAVCPGADVVVRGHGNVLTAVGFLMGLACEEFEARELAHEDPRFPVLVSAVVRKPLAA